MWLPVTYLLESQRTIVLLISVLISDCGNKPYSSTNDNLNACRVLGRSWRYTKAFGNRARNFEPWSSDVDDTSPLLTTTPHQWENVSALDRFNVHRCPTCDTGIEDENGVWPHSTHRSLVPLKTHRVERLLRFKVISLAWCGSLEKGIPAQLSSSALDHGSKSRGPSPIVLVLL
ncbi:hypothetical protein TNCV_3966001 [Trichonephila clavipes]|nr:hypothetical protein TNCV_3966001 [Trichonephila clavipes]